MSADQPMRFDQQIKTAAARYLNKSGRERIVWQLARESKLLNEVYESYDGKSYTYYSGTEKSHQLTSIDMREVFALSSIKLPGTVPLFIFSKDGRFAGTSTTGSELPPGASNRLLGYIFPQKSSGLEPLTLSKQGNQIRLGIAISDSEIDSSLKVIGYTFASRFPRRVGVYYFGMFSPKAWDSAVKAKIERYWGVLPNDYWWAGVRDLYEHNPSSSLQKEEPEAKNFFAEDWSTLKPAIGWYDQSKTETLEKHINQAISNGISYFNFYWYWNWQTKAEETNDGLDSFLRAKNVHDIDFMISICEHGWNLRLPSEQFQEVAELLVKKYFAHQNYLSTRDGHLIVQICDPKGIRRSVQMGENQPYRSVDNDGIRQFIQQLRMAADRALGRRLLILVREDTTVPVNTAGDGFDGGTCIAPVLNVKDSFMNYHLARLWISSFSAHEQFMPCLPERFDERPRLGILKHSDKIAYPAYWVSPEQFEGGLKEMRSWMDLRPGDELAQFITLYAWNEWHEGGILEPNAKTGAAYINRIPGAMGVPFIGMQCRKTGICTSESDN